MNMSTRAVNKVTERNLSALRRLPLGTPVHCTEVEFGLGPYSEHTATFEGIEHTDEGVRVRLRSIDPEGGTPFNWFVWQTYNGDHLVFSRKQNWRTKMVIRWSSETAALAETDPAMAAVIDTLTWENRKG
jgi:hypothetical protein